MLCAGRLYPRRGVRCVFQGSFFRFIHARGSSAPSGVPPSPSPSTTERILLAIDDDTNAAASEKNKQTNVEAGGAGGANTLAALRRTDAAWASLRASTNTFPKGMPPFVTTTASSSITTSDTDDVYDVVVCGGTLGILVATALQTRGHKCAVIERGPLRGRQQEWNVSRKELAELVKLGILTQEDLEPIISIEFNPVRCAFHDAGESVLVNDILNLGVSPAELLIRVRRRFESVGGTVLEHTALEGIEVHPDAAVCKIANSDDVKARLVLDCMGFGSPAVRQARGADARPDGVCLVVGSCASGFDPAKNTSGDLIYTCTDATEQGQYFWEAFPAGSGADHRTTYMFSYLDASEHRPSLEEMFEDYWRIMPAYQNVELEHLKVQRVLFGFFPTYRDSPLQPQWNRILQVGDASGIQSPLSFGGFGALIRHLPRLQSAIDDALTSDLLERDDLALINAYQPSLSGAWLFQRAMSIPKGAHPPPTFINNLLGTNFGVMEKLGDGVLRPFLQDVIQFGPLARTLLNMAVSNPPLTARIVYEVGPSPILDWVRHFAAMGAFTALDGSVGAGMKQLASDETNMLSERQRFVLRRVEEQWRYGSGLDYHC
ncbi:hypothetical protein NFJ02_07g130940 [Pycnococcus provasolii]